MANVLTIWTNDGREVVCMPLDRNHPLRTSREGFRCKVMTTDGEKGYSHVYYDRKPFSLGNKVGSATIFYQNGTWWSSFVPLRGWSFTFTPPRAKVLKQELTVLAERILEINQELSTLR